MKKTIALILCAVTLCTLLSGCTLLGLLSLIVTRSDGDVSVRPAQTAIETRAPETEAITAATQNPGTEPVVQEPSGLDAVILLDHYDKPYVPYTYDDGLAGESSFDHTIRIPALTCDSADADRINQEIIDVCEEAIALLEAGEENEAIFRYSYSYTDHEGIVGLVMDYTVGYQSAGISSTYDFYFFDQNRGVELSYEEYLQALGMSQESALDAIRSAGIIDVNTYPSWNLEYLITDQYRSIMLIQSDMHIDGHALITADYSVLDYPFH